MVRPTEPQKRTALNQNITKEKNLKFKQDIKKHFEFPLQTDDSQTCSLTRFSYFSINLYTLYEDCISLLTVHDCVYIFGEYKM